MKNCKECCYCVDIKTEKCAILKKSRIKKKKIECWAFADKAEFERREADVREYAKNFGEGNRYYREPNMNI